MKYRVKKDNFLWKEGAILTKNYDGNGYESIDDIFDMPNTGTEYISSRIVENSPEWFEPIQDTVWEAFKNKVERAKENLVRNMRLQWRKDKD